MKKIIFTLLIWAVFGLWSFYWLKVIFSDLYFKKSQDYLRDGKVEIAKTYANKAIEFNSLEPNYYRGRAKVLTVGMVEEEDASVLKGQILGDLEKAYNLNPKNLVTIRNAVPIYYFLAVENISLPSAVSNVDENYLPFAKEFFEMVKKNYLHDAGVVALLAKYEKKLGLENEYQKSVEIVKKLRPELLEWHPSFR